MQIIEIRKIQLFSIVRVLAIMGMFLGLIFEIAYFLFTGSFGIGGFAAQNGFLYLLFMVLFYGFSGGFLGMMISILYSLSRRIFGGIKLEILDAEGGKHV